MSKMSNSMQAGKVQSIGKDQGQDGAGQVQALKQQDIGPLAQQEEARIEQGQADQKRQVKEQQEDAQREERQEGQQEHQAQNATRDQVETKREDGDRQWADEMDAALLVGRAAEVAQNARVDQSESVEQSQRSDEKRNESRDNEQFVESQQGRERVEDDRHQIDQAAWLDAQHRQEEDITQQGGQLLRDAEEQQKTAFDEQTSVDTRATAERSQAQYDQPVREAWQVDKAAYSAELHAATEQVEMPMSVQEPSVALSNVPGHGQMQEHQQEQVEDQARVQWLRALREEVSALQQLDDAALERVLAKSNDKGNMYGQLVEEFGSLQLEKMAQELGSEYSFIRGDRIKDQEGSLTDGMIVQQAQDAQGLLNVVAVAEAKASERRSTEFAAKEKNFAALRGAEYASLEGEAIEEIRQRSSLEKSDRLRETHHAEIQDIMRDIHGPDMGQLRQDLERMMPMLDGSAVEIWIDGQPQRIRASMSQTEMLAIAPKDVEIDRILEDLKEKDRWIRTRSINIDQTVNEIRDMAEKMQHAEQRYKADQVHQASAQPQAALQQQADQQQTAEHQQQAVQQSDKLRTQGIQEQLGQQSEDLLNLRTTQGDVSRSAGQGMDMGSEHTEAWEDLAAMQNQSQALLNLEVDELERSRELARNRARAIRELDDALEVFNDD